MNHQRDALEREWRQNVTDATAVFGRIDKDLSALGGRVGLDEHKLEGHEAMIKSFEDDYSKVLFRVHELEQGRRAQLNLIESLQTDVAFFESNSAVDAQRIEALEGRLDDLTNLMGHMQSRLCSCGDKVRVFLL